MTGGLGPPGLVTKNWSSLHCPIPVAVTVPPRMPKVKYMTLNSEYEIRHIHALCFCLHNVAQSKWKKILIKALSYVSKGGFFK